MKLEVPTIGPYTLWNKSLVTNFSPVATFCLGRKLCGPGNFGGGMCPHNPQRITHDCRFKLVLCSHAVNTIPKVGRLFCKESSHPLDQKMSLCVTLLTLKTKICTWKNSSLLPSTQFYSLR